MKLKLTLGRPNGSLQDIVVTTDASATVGDVAQTIELVDPAGGAPVTAETPTFHVTESSGGSTTLVASTPIAETPLASGAVVRVVPAASHSNESASVVAVLRIIDGPHTGREYRINEGGVILGRSQNATVQLDDPLVSKFHARIEVGRTLDLIDLNSANGLIIDGQQFSRVSLETGQTVLVGGTTLRAEILVPTAESTSLRGPVHFVRSPRVEPRYPRTEHPAPEIPQTLETQPFPWIALVAPIIMGSVLFAFTRNPISLVFVALSPVIMMGTWITQRTTAKRKYRDQVDAFEQQLVHLRETMERERAVEQQIRRLEAPSTAEILQQAAALGPLLWTRRAEHWSFLHLRLGLGTVPSRNVIAEVNERAGVVEFVRRLQALDQAFERIDGVPLVEDLLEAGAIGLTGPAEARGRVANALVAQITGLHSPADVSIAAIAGPESAPSFEWLKWLPHVDSAESPMAGASLGDTAGSGSVVLSRLEELIETRLASNKAKGTRGPLKPGDAAMEAGAEVGGSQEDAPGGPFVVVLIADDAPVDIGRLIQMTERAADAGVLPIWLADRVDALPAACRTFVELIPETGAARVGYVRLGSGYENVDVEHLDSDTAQAYARHLAGVHDAGVVSADSSDIPTSIALASLLGPEMLSAPDAVIDRWRQNDSIHDRTPGAPHRKRRTSGKLRAIVGQSSMDAMHLDLRVQGPHALVGGTTGSGKSEFLQAWVLGMAAEFSPDRVTFLFVDYKGGSAFADCVNLPHCVGLVTDLSPHLVRRALTSLRAELHHREHLFNRKKVKDLLELEKSGDPESPPALVLVIDEFAALVGEVPEFVDGVVDIAQRGRSLGIHLIMATQRPAGVIKDNLRANTNLRIALRMADESDSNDVVGIDDAGRIDPSLPGRGIAKTGPGRLMMFQSGYAGGWTTDEPAAPRIDVAALRFGGEQPWEPPERDRPGPETDLGPNDQQRMVRSMIDAAALSGVPDPRRPWLDELAPAYDLGGLRQRTDRELLIGVSDIPEAQRQEAVYFRPDVDGHLAVYGTGGTGKSTLLRTLATAAAITPRGGPVLVYGLDFGAGSLRMLEQLPHVGGVVSGDDSERIVRLLRMLRDILDERRPRFAAAEAATIGDYRQISGRADEPRILLLIDGFPNFREDWEIPSGRNQWYGVFQDIIADGRQLGVHVAFTADRPGSVPSSVSSSVQRRVVLRLADDAGYGALDVPSDILGAGSPAGRAVVDGHETQVAVLGGSSVLQEQSASLKNLATAMRRAGSAEAPPVEALPKEYSAETLPSSIDGKPVLGLSDVDLGPVGFEAVGAFLIAGPPASGRTNALRAVVGSLHRWDPEMRLYYVGNRRSPLAQDGRFVERATSIEDAAALAKDLAAAVADPDTEGRIGVIIEQIGDFLQTQADNPIVDLIRAAKRSDHFILAEAEMSSWSSSWPLIGEFKSARRGLLLQPEGMDGDVVLKTSLPRMQRAEFPEGRGVAVQAGKFVKVQLPLVGTAT